MRRRAEGAKRPCSCGVVLLRTVGGSNRRAMTGSVHNDTSVLHASLHGAASRDPRGGENPMMRLHPPQLAACPVPGEMRSNMERNHKTTKTFITPGGRSGHRAFHNNASLRGCERKSTMASRSQKRWGGYTAEDCDCKICLYYGGKVKKQVRCLACDCVCKQEHETAARRNTEVSAK